MTVNRLEGVKKSPGVQKSHCDNNGQDYGFMRHPAEVILQPESQSDKSQCKTSHTHQGVAKFQPNGRNVIFQGLRLGNRYAQEDGHPNHDPGDQT